MGGRNRRGQLRGVTTQFSKLQYGGRGGAGACGTSVLYTSVRVCETQCSERDEACEGEAKPGALLRPWSALFARWSAVCSSKSKKQVLSLTALAVRNSVPPFRGRYGVHTSNGPHGGGRGSSRLFTPLSESHRIDRWCCMGQEMRAESTAREPDATRVTM